MMVLLVEVWQHYFVHMYTKGILHNLVWTLCVLVVHAGTEEGVIYILWALDTKCMPYYHFLLGDPVSLHEMDMLMNFVVQNLIFISLHMLWLVMFS